MDSEYQIVYCTCPDNESAEYVANILIEKSLAACVSILPGITSIYAWQNTVETNTEHLLMIKSKVKVYDALETAILTTHPYDIPEIIAVPIQMGLQSYLQWIDDSIQPE